VRGTPQNGSKTAGIPANQAAGACNNAKDATALLAPGAQGKITDSLIANLFDQPAVLSCAKKAAVLATKGLFRSRTLLAIARGSPTSCRLRWAHGP
jgi:hypothetical protein